jgi:hypothetical protein
MKRIFTLSIMTIGLLVFFTGCVKNREYIDESYWLNKERGEVVFSDSYCSYYIVETDYGYTVLHAPSGYKPYEGAIVFGNFSNYGFRDFYSRSSGTVFSAEVVEYWLSYSEAQAAVDYYCY